MMALVKSQIDAALESLEMEVRLSGGSKTPGQQAIDDAVQHLIKEREVAPSSAAGSTHRGSVVVPKRGKLGKVPRAPSTGSSGGNMEEEKAIHPPLQRARAGGRSSGPADRGNVQPREGQDGTPREVQGVNGETLSCLLAGVQKMDHGRNRVLAIPRRAIG